MEAIYYSTHTQQTQNETINNNVILTFRESCNYQSELRKNNVELDNIL